MFTKNMFQAGSPVTFAYNEEIEVSQSSAGDTGVSSAERTAAPLTGLRAWAPWRVDCGPPLVVRWCDGETELVGTWWPVGKGIRV